MAGWQAASGCKGRDQKKVKYQKHFSDNIRLVIIREMSCLELLVSRKWAYSFGLENNNSNPECMEKAMHYKHKLVL